MERKYSFHGDTYVFPVILKKHGQVAIQTLGMEGILHKGEKLLNVFITLLDVRTNSSFAFALFTFFRISTAVKFNLKKNLIGLPFVCDLTLLLVPEEILRNGGDWFYEKSNPTLLERAEQTKCQGG